MKLSYFDGVIAWKVFFYEGKYVFLKVADISCHEEGHVSEWVFMVSRQTSVGFKHTL